MTTPINKDIVLDLKHHHGCTDHGSRLLSRLTRRAKISEILDSLGGASSLEIRFSSCPGPADKDDSQKLFIMP